jgi:hypothetical protein
MKTFFVIAPLLFFGAQSHAVAQAADLNVSCVMDYTSPNGKGSFNIVTVIPFGDSKKLNVQAGDIGGLHLEIAAGGEATIANGEKSPQLSIKISDKSYLNSVGEISVNKSHSVKAEFPPLSSTSIESAERLKVDCKIVD